MGLQVFTASAEHVRRYRGPHHAGHFDQAARNDYNELVSLRQRPEVIPVDTSGDQHSECIHEGINSRPL